MKFYNFNTKNLNAYCHYQKNYIAPLSSSVNSLFDYILNFNPDYDILNKDNRGELLKENHNFMRNIGFYWGERNGLIFITQEPSPQ